MTVCLITVMSLILWGLLGHCLILLFTVLNKLMTILHFQTTLTTVLPQPVSIAFEKDHCEKPRQRLPQAAQGIHSMKTFRTKGQIQCIWGPWRLKWPFAIWPSLVSSYLKDRPSGGTHRVPVAGGVGQDQRPTNYLREVRSSQEWANFQPPPGCWLRWPSSSHSGWQHAAQNKVFLHIAYVQEKKRMGMPKGSVHLIPQLELGGSSKSPWILRKEQLTTYFRSSCIRVLTIHIGFIKVFVTKARRRKKRNRKCHYWTQAY